jgi:hypothetical protein
MADGSARLRLRGAAAQGPAPETLARVDLLLGLLGLAVTPCQSTRIQLAMGWTTSQTQVATEFAGKRGLVYQEGPRHTVGWALTEEGAAASKSNLGRVTSRQADIASGRLRVCPTCSAEHPESEAGVDLRRLNGRADLCSSCLPAKGDRPSCLPKGAPPMKAAELRVLGFLATHPFRFAVTPKLAEAVTQLRRRLYVETETVKHDGEGKSRPVDLVKPTSRGLATARELGLVCPGRESGECEECRRAVASDRGEG